MDKYQELRDAVGVLQEEARRAGATNPRSALILNLLADYDELRPKAARWDAVETLMILGDVELKQADDGGYRVSIDPVENFVSQTWEGDTPDQVVDKVVVTLAMGSDESSQSDVDLVDVLKQRVTEGRPIHVTGQPSKAVMSAIESVSQGIAEETGQPVRIVHHIELPELLSK